MDLSSLPVPVFALISNTIFNNVRTYVTRPFIDEIFHLRQCQIYCNHDFYSWDDKITTPPGLYLLGTAYSNVLHAFGNQNPCGYDALRSLNLLAGAVVLPLVLSMVRTSNYWKINIMSMPILFTYYFLFYTDVWSTVLVLACVLSIANNRSLKGALIANFLGFCSLWFRQTNIVWIAFAGLFMIDTRRRKCPTFSANIVSFVKQALSDWMRLTPFCLNGIMFAAFVKINGGITFGDKENHQVTIHLVQIFYCFTFITLITTPIWLSKSTMCKYYRFAISGNKFGNVVATSFSLFAIRYVIQNFTIVHPFLLADNRHYTFYIYRRVLSRPYADIILTPIYHFSMWLVAHFLTSASNKSPLSISPLLVIGFFGAASLTLIPSPLFEPRYYIVPLLLFRVFTRPENPATRSQRHMLEFLWYTLINTVFFIVFFSYEFTWFSEPGVQRIIW